jgi:hypothetical protein
MLQTGAEVPLLKYNFSSLVNQKTNYSPIGLMLYTSVDKN